MQELDGKKRIIDYETVINPDENYYVPVDNGTEGTGKVSVKMVGPSDMISDAYDATSTYKVGDLCIYNNKLYVCTVDIDTPHAFDLSEWDPDTLGNYVSEIKSSLSDYPTDVNVPMASGGGTYINAEYTHRVFKYLNFKILELTFEFKSVTAGGSYKEIYNLPSGYRPKADKSAFFITAQNKYVQIRLGTDGTVKFYSNNAFQNGELVAVYYIYL